MSFENIKIDVAIFTKDMTYAYKMRNKCNSIKINLNYIDNLKQLLFYMMEHDKCILLIDLKYFKFIQLILQFCEYKNKGNIIFVFLNDNFNLNIKIEDENAYKTNYENIKNTFFEIYEKKKIEYNGQTSPKSNLMENIVDALLKFKISPKHIGYTYLKECLILGLNQENNSLQLNAKVYPYIANKFMTTISNVEKCIRIAIKKAKKNFPEAFDVDVIKNKKVTNRAFLRYLIEKIKARNSEI